MPDRKIYLNGTSVPLYWTGEEGDGKKEYKNPCGCCCFTIGLQSKNGGGYTSDNTFYRFVKGVAYRTISTNNSYSSSTVLTESQEGQDCDPTGRPFSGSGFWSQTKNGIDGVSIWPAGITTTSQGNNSYPLTPYGIRNFGHVTGRTCPSDSQSTTFSCNFGDTSGSVLRRREITDGAYGCTYTTTEIENASTSLSNPISLSFLQSKARELWTANQGDWIQRQLEWWECYYGEELPPYDDPWCWPVATRYVGIASVNQNLISDGEIVDTIPMQNAVSLEGSGSYRIFFTPSPTGYLKVWLERGRLVVRYSSPFTEPFTSSFTYNSEIINVVLSSTKQDEADPCGNGENPNYQYSQAYSIGDLIFAGDIIDPNGYYTGRTLGIRIKKYSFLPDYEPDISDPNNPQPNGFPNPNWQSQNG
jgi:hypothetical protein